MATKTPTSPQEQDEAYARAQELYDREFNMIKQHHESLLEDGEAGANSFYDELGSDGADSFHDALNSAQDDDSEPRPRVVNDNADDPNANIEKAREQEASPEPPIKESENSTPPAQGRGSGFLGRLGGKIRNIGPGFTIGTTTLASMGVIGTMMSPGVLLVQMKEVFHNDGADATRSSNLFSRAMTAFKLGKSDCSKPGIKCKMSTMSKEQVEKYRNAGFKIEGDGIDKDGKDTGEKAQDADDPDKNTNDNKSARYKVTAVVFPNGDRIEAKDRNMGQKFHDLVKRNIHMRIASLKAFNPKSAVYQSKAFNKILSNFKLAKGRVIKGATDEDRKKDFNAHSGGQSDADNHDEAKLKEQEKKVSDEVTNKANELNNKEGAGFKAGGALALVQVSCGVYNFSRVAVATVKAEQIAKLIGFGFMFLQAADQIKNNGSIEPETVAMLATMLTFYESNKTMNKDDKTIGAKKGDKNPRYNLAAPDSQGYRIAQQGDKSGLKAFAKNYMVGGNGPVASVSNALSQTQNFFGQGNTRTGKERIRTICKNANSLPVLVASLVAACLSGVVGEGVGAFVTIGLCVAVQLGKNEAYNQVIQRFIMPKLLAAAVAFMSTMNLGSDLKGVDAGNAMAVGAGLMLGTTATEYGNRPAANDKETQEYVAYTDQFEEDYREVAIYEARQTPFDYTNQYSFLGSIVHTLNLQPNASAPVFAGIANILNILPTSFATVGGRASALYNQPSLTPSERFNCPDEDLINITIEKADKFCQIRGITPVKTGELQKLEEQAQDKNDYINETIDWMQQKQTAYESDEGTADGSADCDDKCKEESQLASIDDKGKPIEKSQYSKYIMYCTKRTLVEAGGTPDYWGTSTHGVEEGSAKDQDWFTGEQCLKDTKMMQMFRAYTGLCHDSANKDNASTCYEDDSSPVVQSGNVCDILNNPNIIFVNEGTKEGLKEICETGHSTNSCGKEFTINQMLIDTMVTLSSKYKIWVNNFGFEKDRYSCDSGQHPLGNAIDLNGIEKIGGGRAGGDSWGGINFSASQVPVVKEYAEDWLATLPSNRGGVGQKGCGGFDIDPAPGATSVNGYMFFEDSCDHLHIDIRNRDDVNKV